MDDARADLQQVMQSADFRAFCSLCQEQGAAQDPFEICATFIGHRSKRRLEELDAQHRKAIGAQRDRLGELLSLREPGDDPEALHTQVNAVQLATRARAAELGRQRDALNARLARQRQLPLSPSPDLPLTPALTLPTPNPTPCSP